MLTIPTWSPNSICLLGIDPGTTKLGVSIMDISLNTFEILSTQAQTINGEKLANHSLLESHYSNRHSRINGMMDYLLNLCINYQPFAIISEAPFYNPTRPAAFEALVDVINALRNMVLEYDIYKPLILVPPSNVKNAVGAKGGANKITIKDAVKKLTDLNYKNQEEFHNLDEHAIDSIAVNYWYYKEYLLGNQKC